MEFPYKRHMADTGISRTTTDHLTRMLLGGLASLLEDVFPSKQRNLDIDSLRNAIDCGDTNAYLQ